MVKNDPKMIQMITFECLEDQLILFECFGSEKTDEMLFFDMKKDLRFDLKSEKRAFSGKNEVVFWVLRLGNGPNPSPK